MPMYYLYKTIVNFKIVNSIPQQVPDPQQRVQLQQTLAQLNPKFAATGHGSCLKF